MNLPVVLLSVLLTANSSPIANPVPTDEDTLVLLHVLFRHGNRTPDLLYPTDPNLNETFAPFGFGQLTNKGKKTEYEIGRYLRETYGKLIPEQYTPNVLYALSTNTPRTKMSLELVLAGLFPPLPTDVIEENLNWQPIPFDVEQGAGLINTPLLYCTNHLVHYYEYLFSEEGQTILADYKDLYQQLADSTGIGILTPELVSNIFATLKSEVDYGLVLPEWTNNIFPEVLEEASGVFFEFVGANTLLKKLSSGFLLRKILLDSLLRKDGLLSSDLKIMLYSAHDVNVGAMLQALNLFERHVPPYGATLFFEVHNVNGTHGLKLYYQDYKEASPKLLTIPGCSSFCDLDQLYQLVEAILPGLDDTCELA